MDFNKTFFFLTTTFAITYGNHHKTDSVTDTGLGVNIYVKESKPHGYHEKLECIVNVIKLLTASIVLFQSSKGSPETYIPSSEVQCSGPKTCIVPWENGLHVYDDKTKVYCEAEVYSKQEEKFRKIATNPLIIRTRHNDGGYQVHSEGTPSTADQDRNGCMGEKFYMTGLNGMDISVKNIGTEMHNTCQIILKYDKQLTLELGCVRHSHYSGLNLAGRDLILTFNGTIKEKQQMNGSKESWKIKEKIDISSEDNGKTIECYTSSSRGNQKARADTNITITLIYIPPTTPPTPPPHSPQNIEQTGQNQILTLTLNYTSVDRNTFIFNCTCHNKKDIDLIKIYKVVDDDIIPVNYTLHDHLQQMIDTDGKQVKVFCDVTDNLGHKIRVSNSVILNEKYIDLLNSQTTAYPVTKSSQNISTLTIIITTIMVVIVIISLLCVVRKYHKRCKNKTRTTPHAEVNNLGPDQEAVYSYVPVTVMPFYETRRLAAANNRLVDVSFIPSLPARPRNPDSEYDYASLN